MLHQVKIGEKKIFMYYVRAVVMDDQKTKEKMKKYADKSRKLAIMKYTKWRFSLLVRQRRKNKFSTPFEPIPYIVE